MSEKTQQIKRWIVPAVLTVLLVIAIAVVVAKRQPPSEESIGDYLPPLGYAEGVTVVDDPNALQNAVDEMFSKAAEGSIALEYQNDASSSDGKTFSCYIANSVLNSYDLYIDIYADQTLTDEIYLSGLIRPGYALREIALDKALSAGTHRVYVAFTQVEDDHTAIHGQVIVTMDFTVTKS